MRVIQQNGVFKASKISGPKHNYLGIGFSDRQVDVQLVEKDLGEPAGQNLVKGADVLAVVREVVERETAQQQRQMYVSLLEFVPTDTADQHAYAELASAITRHALEAGVCLKQ